jgi:hypothetical protein
MEISHRATRGRRVVSARQICRETGSREVLITVNNLKFGILFPNSSDATWRQFHSDFRESVSQRLSIDLSFSL